MKNNVFGLGELIIDAALKKGILIEMDDGRFVPQVGPLSLSYHPSLRRYVFVFGTTAENAGFVLLEDYNKHWKLR